LQRSAIAIPDRYPGTGCQHPLADCEPDALRSARDNRYALLKIISIHGRRRTLIELLIEACSTGEPVAISRQARARTY
jgi:hypothetical protein